MPDAVQCQFELTPQAVIRFHSSQLYKSQGMRLLTAIATLIFVVVISIQTGNGEESGGISPLFYWIGLYVLILSVWIFTTIRRVKSRFVPERRIYTLTKDGLEFSAPSQSGRLNWSDFKYLRISGDMLVFYAGPDCVHWIPANGFASSADRKLVIAWARAGMPGKGKERKPWLIRIGWFLLLFLVATGVIHFISTQPAP